MKNTIIAALFAFFAVAGVVYAAPVSWDYTGTQLRPLQSTWGVPVTVPSINATSSTATNTLPIASSTTICLGSDCRTAWPSGGGGGTLWEYVGGVLRPLTAYWTSPVQVPSIISTSTATSTFAGAVAIGSSTSQLPFEVWSGGQRKLAVQATGRNILVGSTNGGSVDFANSANNINVSSSMFQFNTNQSQGYNFSGGNVGIGTTTPNRALQVAGTIASGIPATTQGNITIFGGTSQPDLTLLGFSNGIAQINTASGAERLVEITNTNATFSLGLSVEGLIRSSSTLSILGTSTLATTSITSLAIGTSTALGIFDVSGSSSATDLVAFDTARYISMINRDATANNAQGLALRSVTASGTIQSGVKLLGVNTARSATGLTSDLAILTNTDGTISEKMRILSNGRVGIGTSTPLSALSVVGTTTSIGLSVGTLTGFLRATAGAIGTGLVSLASDITGVLGISNGGTGTSTAPGVDTILVGNGTNYDYDRLVAGTNITISTSTPGQLQISATSGSSGTVNSGLAGQIAWYGANGTAVSGTSTLTIATSTGFIGIGTTSPVTNFAVTGASIFTGGITANANLTVSGLLTNTNLNGGATAGLNNHTINFTMSNAALAPAPVALRSISIRSIGSSTAANTGTTTGIWSTARYSAAFGTNPFSYGVAGSVENTGAGTTSVGYSIFGIRPFVSAGSMLQRWAGGFDGSVWVADSLSVGTTSTSSASILVNNGLQLQTANNKPLCAATTTRGMFWASSSASGIKDTVEVCAKDAADAYAWRTLY